MPKCKKIQKTDYIVCSGDMNKSVTLYTRSIIAPILDSVDFEEIFVEPVNVKAMIETVKGESIFFGANVKTDVTHKFTIRYIPSITFENYIVYDNKRYSILDVENQNEMNKFFILRCSDRGFSNLKVTEL